MITLIWFQRDLRVIDNQALNWALNRGKPILAVFVHSPEEDEPWQSGAASSWWLHHSLKKLSVDLDKKNIKLLYFKANSVDKIPELITIYNIDSVCWTNRHEPQRILYEDALEASLQTNGITVKRFKDELLAEADQFLTKANTPYKVFTPFYKRLRHDLNGMNFDSPIKQPKWHRSCYLETPGIDSNLEQLKLLDVNYWHKKLSRHWTPGEQSALLKLDAFIEQNLETYSHHRDFPSISGTSSLSPHLHFGEITSGQIIKALTPHTLFNSTERSDNFEIFLRQIIWREFARYILHHFPETACQAMNKKFSQSFWQNDENNLQNWQLGKTGVPIIDAGMRQLWETGWMHNRVRMLAGSFLTKNLGIPWQAGARWFWHTLVDADLANNSMGWQWVAGCGVDAAPYFRIFNPYTQAQRFDKNHLYSKFWNGGKTEQATTQAVDVAQSRKDALLRYKRLMQNQR